MRRAGGSPFRSKDAPECREGPETGAMRRKAGAAAEPRPCPEAQPGRCPAVQHCRGCCCCWCSRLPYTLWAASSSSAAPAHGAARAHPVRHARLVPYVLTPEGKPRVQADSAPTRQATWRPGRAARGSCVKAGVPRQPLHLLAPAARPRRRQRACSSPRPMLGCSGLGRWLWPDAAVMCSAVASRQPPRRPDASKPVPAARLAAALPA